VDIHLSQKMDLLVLFSALIADVYIFDNLHCGISWLVENIAGCVKDGTNKK